MNPLPPSTSSPRPTLLPAFAALLLLAGCMSEQEARCYEYHRVTDFSDWGFILFPLLLALALVAQAFIPALRRCCAMLLGGLLRMLGMKRLLNERANLLADYVSRLGIACGLFLLLILPCFFGDCYFPALGIGLTFAAGMDIFVIAFSFMALALLWLTLRLIARWWRLNHHKG